MSRTKNNIHNHVAKAKTDKTKLCNICGNQITQSTSLRIADSRGLCASCCTGFMEMMRAVGALHNEMAKAYGVDPNDTDACSKILPGISVDEIAIRMELNRLKVSSH